MARLSKPIPRRKAEGSREGLGCWGEVDGFGKGLLDGHSRIPDPLVGEQIGILQML